MQNQGDIQRLSRSLPGMPAKVLIAICVQHAKQIESWDRGTEAREGVRRIASLTPRQLRSTLNRLRAAEKPATRREARMRRSYIEALRKRLQATRDQ